MHRIMVKELNLVCALCMHKNIPLQVCPSQCQIGSNQALSKGYGMALQNEVIAFLLQNPFYLVQISHFTRTKANQMFFCVIQTPQT